MASIPELLKSLGTTGDGLTEAEAALRLGAAGPNVLESPHQLLLLRLLASRFRNPLIILLLLATVLSAVTGDTTSAAVITVIVGLSVILDAVQEYRAGKAAERLRDSVAMTSRVMRGGVERQIPARDIVPGDVILLSAGDLVPADGRLLDGDDCFVNQAMLTGEPYPVEKRPGSEDDALFQGSSVVSGWGRLLAVQTGRATTLGQIGQRLQSAPPTPEFERGSRAFGLLILRLAILMVGFVVLINLFRQRPPLETFLFAIALAVGLTPELLPMVVSVTLARGALRMAARKVIVKRLAAIHDLGAMDLLCTDKTGTLTEGRIRLERHLDPSGRESERVLELAWLNSHFESGLKSPMDDAILQHTQFTGAGWTKLDETPFDFQRRRVAVLLGDASSAPLLVVKGALEDVLRLSRQYEGDGPADLRVLEAADSTAMLGRFEALGKEGFRVLGVAWKRMPAAASHATAADESDMVFAGFAGFADPPKASAREALKGLAENGVALKVVTGDNEWVTQHVCREVGLPVQALLTGPDLDRLDDDALAARVEATTVFCRVNPLQKNRVILALKRRGRVVGYLGDGINDAPSLHAADVGISVESAVDVAREAADLILLEADLGVLCHGVLEGRRTQGNILKYVMMATSSNFGNMFSMAGASVLLPFLPMLPGQVLLNNFLYDLSEVAIPMDGVDAEELRHPRRWDIRFIRSFMLSVGPVSSVFDFLTFYLMLHLFHAGEALFHTGWFVESLATQVLVIFVIRTRGNPFRSRPSTLLTVTSLSAVAIATLLPFTVLGTRLGFVPLPWGFFLALA
ncbi:MAG: magnesium-translocating P-type ATPase, partial [Gemmatimonadales bacterium]